MLEEAQDNLIKAQVIHDLVIKISDVIQGGR